MVNQRKAALSLGLFLVRIADFSMAVPVVGHVVARPPQVWGFMDAISEVWGCSAGGVK
jgi:hypothetical protein